MAAIGSSVLTLLDWANRQDPDGKVAQVVEMLSQRNEILLDMLWKMGNLEIGHQFVYRATLPTVFYRQFNAGVAVSKSTTGKSIEQTAMLEAWSEVDVDIAEQNGDVDAFRLSETVAFIEALNQQTSISLIYGNVAVSPDQFTGFAPRFGTLSTNASPLPSAANTLTGGGSTSVNQNSIFLIGWGDRSAYGIFPKGSKAGIVYKNKGIQTIYGATVSGTFANPVGSTRQEVYQEHFQWKQGLVLEDWRNSARIPNIDSTNLVAGNASASDLIRLMIKAWHRIYSRSSVKLVYYMNRTCFEMLDIQARDQVAGGGQLKYEVVDGVPQLSFRGIPIRMVDAMLTTEAVVA